MDIANLMDFLSVRSISGDEYEAARWLRDNLIHMGWDAKFVEVAAGRVNVVSNLNSKLLFCSHTDVVPPFIPPKRIGDVIHGRGSADAKGVIFAQMEAARKLVDEGVYRREEIGFAYVVGEEVDHIGAQHLSTMDFEAENVIVGEPTNNRLCRYGFGLLKLKLSTEGVAGHSAFPESGRSAIHELVGLLSRLSETVGEGMGGMSTTYNIGLVTGGTAANVFAPHASATVLYRLTEMSELVMERVDGLISKLAPNTEYEVLSCFEPMEFSTFDDVEQDVARFNSDAKYFLGHAERIFLFGPGNISLAHSENEMIRIGDIEEGIRLYHDVAVRLRSSGT